MITLSMEHWYRNKCVTAFYASFDSNLSCIVWLVFDLKKL